MLNNVVLISCSNGLKEEAKAIILELKEIFHGLNINCILSDRIFQVDGFASGTPKERGEELMGLFKDPSIDMIFDVSGGDLSNEILPYLDFEIIKENPKVFWGYSDLSVVLNSLYSQSQLSAVLYQIKNITKDKELKSHFCTYILNNKSDLFDFKYKWLQGYAMEGIVVGGNIRCSLKLAGTKYMPDFNNKILLLESLGGDVYKMRTYLTQLKQIGAFSNIKGIILGTFTEMEKNNLSPTIEELLLNIVDNPSLPIIKTEEIGHGSNSKAIKIGEHYKFS